MFIDESGYYLEGKKMVGTIFVHGSDNEVMAPFGSGDTFIRGKCAAIRVTAVGKDKETPLSVRGALVGMEISCIFTKAQLGPNFASLPDGCRLAYTTEVIAALTVAGKDAAARDLRNCSPNDLDMYVFEQEIFVLL